MIFFAFASLKPLALSITPTVATGSMSFRAYPAVNSRSTAHMKLVCEVEDLVGFKMTKLTTLRITGSKMYSGDPFSLIAGINGVGTRKGLPSSRITVTREFSDQSAEISVRFTHNLGGYCYKYSCTAIGVDAGGRTKSVSSRVNVNAKPGRSCPT
ncbi:hypothetical protein PoB_000412200 [Plakobranchus ocellatus]|uniref:Uncharacterized protein n=1 Tax=Plakobranchus ocellatus TaxID=259542 RepID=A0AAV3Y658_9GAST|nr:hypothetical protein PoB_000412200 [Plakobranchus ocellatus]